jgi:threonine dehydrogenase-like Zn-dependent dehydrogenase
MRALVLTGDGPAVRADYPTPQAGAGAALVRVRLAGVCATDLELLRGYKGGYRGVLGHEFVGEVVDAPGNEAWAGRRVVGEINVGCGACDLCRRGLGKHCRARRTLGIIRHDGAFAEYLTLPVANLHAVPDGVPDEAAVFAEPLAAALQVPEQVHVAPSDRVIVLGDGRLGLLVAQVLGLLPCDLTLIGRTPAKLEIAARRGIRTLDTGDAGALDALTAHPADVVVEATGSPAGFDLARRLVRPAGTLVLKSTFAGALPAFDASSLVVDEVTLVGSRCGPFAPALALLRAGRVDVASLLHARYPLDEGVAALEHAGRKGVLKVLIQMHAA